MIFLLPLFVAEKSHGMKAPVLVLDCLTMEWSRPVISGRYLADRTRHTAVAVFSEDLTDRGEATSVAEPVFSNDFIAWKVGRFESCGMIFAEWMGDVSPPEGMVLFTVVPIVAELFGLQVLQFLC